MVGMQTWQEIKVKTCAEYSKLCRRFAAHTRSAGVSASIQCVNLSHILINSNWQLILHYSRISTIHKRQTKMNERKGNICCWLVNNFLPYDLSFILWTRLLSLSLSLFSPWSITTQMSDCWRCHQYRLDEWTVPTASTFVFHWNFYFKSIPVEIIDLAQSEFRRNAFNEKIYEWKNSFSFAYEWKWKLKQLNCSLQRQRLNDMLHDIALGLIWCNHSQMSFSFCLFSFIEDLSDDEKQKARYNSFRHLVNATLCIPLPGFFIFVTYICFCFVCHIRPSIPFRNICSQFRCVVCLNLYA